jgi:hypothetical protein
MQPKQKHKRGADRYSLDFYTPLSRSECMDRLNTIREHYPKGPISVSRTGNTVTIQFRGESSLFTTRIEARLELYVAGTHVHGNIRRRWHIRALWESIKSLFLVAVLLGFPALLLLHKITSALFFFSIILLTLTVIAAIGTIWEIVYSPRHFPRWIVEQLTVVEVSHETKTEA